MSKHLVVINGISAGSYEPDEGHQLWEYLTKNSGEFNISPLKNGYKDWSGIDWPVLGVVLKNLEEGGYVKSSKVIHFSLDNFAFQLLETEKAILWNEWYVFGGKLEENPYGDVCIHHMCDFNDDFEGMAPLELAKLVANSPELDFNKKFFWHAGDSLISFGSIYDEKSPIILSGVGEDFVQNYLAGLVGDDPQNLINEFERITGRKPTL